MRSVSVILIAGALLAQTPVAIYSGVPTVNLSGTLFLPLSGNSSPTQTETATQTKVNAATQYTIFDAALSAPLGVGNSVTFTLRRNGADQSITCSITHPNLTCVDAIHTVTVNAGDQVSFRVTFTGTVTVRPTITTHTQTGNSVFPGQITMLLTGTCPAAYTEVPALNGKTVIGTLAGNGDVGTTGGSDSITPAGTVSAIAATATAALNTPPTAAQKQAASNAHTHPAPTFTGVTFDNRSAFVRVIFCVKN